MSTASEKKLGCFQFGRQLIESKDLDPVYILLHEARLPPEMLKRWLLAYWCFYHIGTSSWIAETQEGYWDRFREAASSKDFPRCHERRHFRGENASKSVEYLAHHGLEKLYQPLLLPREQTAEEVMEKVRKWVGFGPWIAFKVADMLERLGLARIAFDTESVFLFDSPKEGARRLLENLKVVVARSERPGVIESWAVGKILRALDGMDAPPRYERKLNAQEAETVLCKWHSYMKGHYRIGEDIESCKKSLEFRPGTLSKRLKSAGKEGGLW